MLILTTSRVVAAFNLMGQQKSFGTLNCNSESLGDNTVDLLALKVPQNSLLFFARNVVINALTSALSSH